MTLRTILPALIGIAALSSCATAYRTGQTPDDVYYSPGRTGAAYVSTDQKRDGRGSYQQQRNDYYSVDDRWLRMRVSNRYRWSAFDDYDWNDYRYNTWAYNSYSPYSWNNYWNSYYRWNSWYNPYCGGIIVVNPKTNPNVYTKVRNFSLNSYTNTNYNNTNNGSAKGMRLSSNPGYNNSNSRSGLGSSIRKAFSGSSRDSYYTPSSSGDRQSRTYTPSSSNNNSSNSGSRSSGGSSGGGSGGSSGGGGVSRPSRGN